MTLVDGPPTTSKSQPDTQYSNIPRQFGVGSSFSAWRLAARLARREVRRRPGRSVLVMLLVAIPVIAMSSASILTRTTNAFDTGTEFSQYGTADVVVSPITYDEATGRSLDYELTPFDASAAPAGTTSTSYLEIDGGFTAQAPDGTTSSTFARMSDRDLASPITVDTIDITDGRAPVGPAEVLIDAGVADDLNVGLGDTLNLVVPEMSLDVVGIGRDPSYWNQRLMIVGELDPALIRPGQGQVQTLLDLPDGYRESLSSSEVTETVDSLRAEGFGVFDTGPSVIEDAVVYDGSPDGRELLWGWVVGVIGFMAVGIVIAAAFATSARRQLVTIGQLSANGASERIVRRTMGLQGAWTGLLGGALGIVVTVIGVNLAWRFGLIEWSAQRSLQRLQIAPLDLIVMGLTAIVAATLAALVPARSASRISVLSALAGRRPVAKVPRWMGPVGVASFVIGVALLAGVTTVDGGDGGGGGDFLGVIAVLGAMAVFAGIVCASPLIVSAVGSIGSRRGGVIRLAARSLSRSRARSAAVITAIAVVGTLAVVGSTAASSASDYDNGGDQNDLSVVRLSFDSNFYSFDDGAVFVEDGVTDYPAVTPPPLSDAFATSIETILPDATWAPVRTVIDDPVPFVEGTGENVDVEGLPLEALVLSGVIVVDDTVRDRNDFTDEQLEILDRVGVLSLSPWAGNTGYIVVEDNVIEVDLAASMESMGFSDVPLTEADSQRAGELVDADRNSGPDRRVSDTFVTEAFAQANGLETAVSDYIVQNPTDLTQEQRNSLNDLTNFSQQSPFKASAIAPAFVSGPDDDSAGFWSTNVDYPSNETDWQLIQAVVALASLIVVLGVVAIGLSLAAAESRDERDILHAVGATPRTLRRVAASKAWVLTTGAAVVAVPAGYLTAFVVVKANDASAPFPFAMALALLIVIPAVAALATLMVSAIAQRFRPVTYSTIIPGA